MSNKDPGPAKGSTTKSDSVRIQSTQAKGGKDMSSKGFSAHAQSAADKNSGAGGQPGQGGSNSGQKSGSGSKK